MRNNISYYCPHWGNQKSFDTFCKNVKNAGYDGVEMDIPFDEDERDHIFVKLKKYQLKLIGQYWQSMEKDFKTHKANFTKYLYHLASFEPVLINTQTGKDYFSFEKNMELIQLAENISKQTGVMIAHETHRGKFLYNLPAVQACVKANKNVKLTLDASHFCNVHESYLEDQAEALQAAITHTQHLHARVGHPEGPQVNDPRAPEWAEALKKHFSWWDQVVALHKKNKTPLTITTEFGPAPYMPSYPYSNKPVAKQWDINIFMLTQLQNRYK